VSTLGEVWVPGDGVIRSSTVRPRPEILGHSVTHGFGQLGANRPRTRWRQLPGLSSSSPNPGDHCRQLFGEGSHSSTLPRRPATLRSLTGVELGLVGSGAGVPYGDPLAAQPKVRPEEPMVVV
jgi:hypothetical protein